MFVTSWWKFMESPLPPATSWTLTPVRRRSSVGISSSISKMQFSKTTYTWVRSMLSKGNFLWRVVLKSYSLCCLGRFIHAILQPILSTLKGGRSHNSGVNSSEMRFGFQISPIKHCFFAINTWGLLFLISEMTAEHLTFLEANQRRHRRVVGVHRPRGPNRRSETCGSSWWRTRTARTVCLLISVRETQKWFAFLCWFSHLSFTKTGVYTKNRNFRLYKSSKAGKRTAFAVAEDNTFHANPEKSSSAEESVFLASLVCNVRYVHVSIECVCPEMGAPFQPRTSLVSRAREYSRGRFPKQWKPKPHGPVASTDQTQITVSFICQSVI